MCQGFSYPDGVPLNMGTMASMSQEEVVFWNDFLPDAQLAIDVLEEEGKQPPFEPPASLRAKYRHALEKYNGGIYCQVRQLQRIFNFGDVQDGAGKDVQTFLRGMGD